jgi:hypothetical protein
MRVDTSALPGVEADSLSSLSVPAIVLPFRILQ